MKTIITLFTAILLFTATGIAQSRNISGGTNQQSETIEKQIDMSLAKQMIPFVTPSGKSGYLDITLKRGVVVSIGVSFNETYTLFKPDGKPIRAKAEIDFVEVGGGTTEANAEIEFVEVAGTNNSQAPVELQKVVWVFNDGNEGRVKVKFPWIR